MNIRECTDFPELALGQHDLSRTARGGRRTSLETATMTPEQVRQVTRTASRDELLEAVREKFDCREADVDAQGDIWIADPECGHWLSDDHLVEFVGWYYRHVR